MVFIPQDIIDCIIDFLHHDQVTLNACSLVERAWVRPARRHLFNLISLGKLTNYRSNVDRLLEYAPQVGHYVRKMYFDRFWFHKTCMDLCLSLKNLSKIEFSCVVIDSDTLLTVLSSLPNLKDVSLLNLYLFPGNYIIPDNRPAVKVQNEIQSLLIHGSGRFKFFESSLRLDLFHRVHTLTYSTCFSDSSDEGEDKGDIIELCIFWKRYGSNLVNVKLENLPPLLSEQLFECLGLLSNLREFNIQYLEIGRRKSDQGWSLSDIPRFLSHVTSLSLTSITWGIMFFDERTFMDKGFDNAFTRVWQDVGQLLISPRFRTVKTVGLGVQGSHQKVSLHLDPLLALEEQGTIRLKIEKEGSYNLT